MLCLGMFSYAEGGLLGLWACSMRYQNIVFVVSR